MTDPAASSPAETDASPATDEGASDESTEAAVALLPAATELARELATSMTDAFGRDDLAAFDPAALGLNNGYDADQLAEAIDVATLGNDGRVDGVDPNLTPPDLNGDRRPATRSA